MAQAQQLDFSDLGGRVVVPAGDGDMPQPIAPVRVSAAIAKVGDYVPIGGQDMYVSGFDSAGRPSLSPGKPPAPAKLDFSDLGAVDFSDLGAKTVLPAQKKQAAPPLTPTTIPTGHVAMTDANNQLQAVPREQAQAKLNAGWKIGPPQQTHYTTAQENASQNTPWQPATPPSANAGWFERHGLVPSSNSVPPPLKPGEQAGATMDVQDTGDLLMQGLMAGREAMTQKGGDIGASLAKKALIPSDNPNDPETVALRKKSPPLFTPPAKPISLDTPLTRGVIGGTGRFIGSTVADPATAAFGALSEAAPAVKGLASLGFSGMMGKGAVDAAGQLGEIWDRDDIPQEQKYEAATQIALSTLAAGSAGAHGTSEILSPDSPIFANIPDADKATLAQRVNAAAKKAGAGVSNIASRAGDVAAEVGNTDMRDNLTPEATIRKSLPQAPVNAIRLALPDIRAVADDAGLKSVTTADLLDSQPDKSTGAVSPGLISEAKKAVIAEAGQAAGPGSTISDLPPEQVQPYIQRLDALDTLHDHIRQAQDKETADLKDAANTPNLPQSRFQGLVRLGRGMGKAAIITAAGPAVGRVSRALMHVYGIPSTFNDVVSGIKAIVGQGGKVSPRLDENINSALGRSPTSSAVTDYGAPGDFREPYSPFQGDTSVQHQYATVPPETPHGEAPLVRDLPSRFQVSSGTTNPVPAGRRVAPMTGRVPVGADNRAASFTSVPEGVTPQPEPTQRSLMDVLAGRAPEAEATHVYDPSTATINPVGDTRTQGAGDYVPRAQHPEEIVQNAMMKLSLPALRELARAGDVGYGSADTHQDLIGKLMDLYAGHEDQLQAVAETLQGQRGEVKPGIRQPAPPDQTDYSDIMQQSIDAANARKGQAPARQSGQQAQPRGFMDIMRGGEDKRTNLDYRAKVDDMNPTAQAKAIYESPLTGLPNKRAFEDFSPALAKSHPHVGYADIDNFKGVNDALGHDGADEVLREIGKLFKQAMEEEGDAVHVFHRSGDEFWFRGTDPDAISRVVDRVNEGLAKTKFTFADENGKEVTQEGVGLSHGTGSTIKAAEAAAEASKELRTRQGKRQPGLRDTFTVRPMGEPTPQGANTEGDNVSQRQNVPSGGVPASEATQRKSLLGFMRGDSSESANGPRIVHAADLKPDDPAMVPMSELHRDSSRFQYKGGTDEAGVTNALKEQTKYDQNKGGVLLVWKDPANGKVYVVNGHHRFDLALRAGEKNVLVKMIDPADAPSAMDAKVIGAETNISEGHGSVVDAARYFKDAGITTAQQAMNRNLPMGQAKVTDGLAMARLDHSIIDKVESGDIPEGQAVAIGKVTSNAAQQEAVLSAIEKAASKGKQLTNGQVEALARRVASSDVRVDQGQDLFGAFQREHSNFIEESEIDDYILRQLRSDKRTFGAVSSKARADALGKVENQSINAEENKRISEQAAQAEALYTKLVNRAGVLSDIRKNAAKELAGRSGRPQDIKTKAYDRVRRELQSQLGNINNDDTEGKRP